MCEECVCTHVQCVCACAVCGVMDGWEAGTYFICVFMHLLWVIDLSEVQVGPRLHIIPNA